MAFPKIDACIVCEGARLEVNNKHVLLGFFGIAHTCKSGLERFNSP